MGGFMTDVVSIFSILAGVAIITVLVRSGSQTGTVLTSAGNAASSVFNAVMGNGNSLDNVGTTAMLG